VAVNNGRDEAGDRSRGAGNGKRMEEQKLMTDRFASTLVIAASIIAAVRLAREQDISMPSPRLTSVITDSVGLARIIVR
jgi:hypothetical protein